MQDLDWKEFERVEMRVGTVIDVREFPKARRPAYKVWVDFGEFGIKKSSAQITECYRKEALQGKQVIAVLNFPPKQIGDFMSECLILGLVGDASGVILIGPDSSVSNGLRVA
jgi:tRNA-binding protein